MASGQRLVALAWHQRASALETRERLLGALTSGPDRLLLATCHRVELYAAIPAGVAVDAWGPALELGEEERVAMVVREEADAAAHLFAVTAGLDSAVVGEPQILGQVRRAYADASDPLLVALLGRALHVGRAIRREMGLETGRSVGSLAVDALLEHLPVPADRATVLVIGAGEMGKLAVRALARRVGNLIVANRHRARAAALAQAHDASAIGIDEVAATLARAHGVISAADTRGALLDAATLAARRRAGPLAVIDIAVPRSIDAAGRAVLGTAYRSVDDLPGARPTVDARVLQAANERCVAEAARFVRSRSTESAEAIRELRRRADAISSARLERAMRRLGHLSERDRAVVATLAYRITNALLHEPTVALRERGAGLAQRGGR